MLNPFKIGNIYSNNDICSTFKVGNAGGMRSSTVNKVQILILDHTKVLYDDRWEGNTLYYVGSGANGNQCVSNANKTLTQAKEKGYTVYLFEVFTRAEYCYMGEVELAGKYYFEDQLDNDGNVRKVIIFPLRMKNPHAVDEVLIEKIQSTQDKRAAKIPSVELKKKAIHASKKPSIRNASSKIYIRNSYVSEYKKSRANGHCELCGQLAPFLDKSGVPYLECHHIIWLSKGGEDSIENTVALCPNCHKKMHVVADQNDIDRLKKLRMNE